MNDDEHGSYMKARFIEFMKNVEDRPFWQWVAVVDPSTCLRCYNLHKKVFMFNDPIWKKTLPPIHKGCRCRFRALSKNDMKKRKLTVCNSSTINNLLFNLVKSK